MAVHSPYNSWASKRPVSHDANKKARQATTVNIQAWAKGKAELENK
ncbi:hypothetical protein G7084_01895 [Weissella coleopterorum]|uniref:Uncharacterized protein n=1 Tax=Weissella coleopterorum TaxID=2714949 RepID=A0A6G8AYP7_9LACO|nr:hypothetical protein [Weissella coleopterorum]QIL50184.1 hypothetical protein G7084_01895 [Weissella coleopterorum]